MTFQTEPALPHGTPQGSAVLLVNLGTPDAPTPSALRRYLREFLGDPRVVEIPRILWWLILHGIVLRVRPAKSATKYAAIWTSEGSPLAVWTAKQARLLQGYLGQRGHPPPHLLVRHAMRYGQPSIASVLDELKSTNATRILVLPLYPQYAAATTASVNDAVMAWMRKQRRQPELRFVQHYHDDPGYIQALVQRVRSFWQMHGRGERLVLSFHGVPERSLHAGDPYHCECQVTAHRLGEALGLARGELLVTFQSRFGKAKWLSPYTQPTLVALAREGIGRVDVMCPGFSADCLETLEEIDREARAAFLGAGGKAFHYIPCLNDQHEWISGLSALALRHLQGWPTTSEGVDDQRARDAQRARALALGAKN